MYSNDAFGKIDKNPARFIFFGFILLLIGCNERTNALLNNSKSPDGAWVVSAENDNGGSFGTSYDITNVYLSRTKGIKEKTRVLSFSHEYNTMRIDIKWLDSKHLEVNYGGVKGKLDAVIPNFVAVKFSDINISMEPILD